MNKVSLWGDDFIIPSNDTQKKKLLDKVKNPKRVSQNGREIPKGLSLIEQIDVISNEVHRILGKYEDNTIVIRSKQELSDYISTAIKNGVIAVDTETNNSLDPLTCKLMGACIYTPTMKQAYIPINHTDINQEQLIDNQLTEQDIKEQFDKLVNTKIIMHNGKFDYQVIKCTCGCTLNVYWDTLIGARILNENEKAGLKFQYIDKIDSSIEKYDIEHLFKKLPYSIFSPELFSLYAATDAYMTYELYKYQKQIFELPDNSKLYSLFRDVEMEVMLVTAEMELTGVELDIEYANRLSNKYNKQLEIVDDKINKELDNFNETISNWRKTPEANFHPKTKQGKDGKSKSEQLTDPINISSPTQLAIFIYDVLKIPMIDKKFPRGTNEEILEKISKKYPSLNICKLILERRGIMKLISTYVDKLPKCVSEVDGRVHANFNQVGTDTGRYSSSDPNLQNIPSANKEIRMMFKAKDGYSLVGADYSQQEPRLLTEYTQDKMLMDAYNNGRDLYATLGVGVYKNNYWDNMEHYEDGRKNPDGAKRRKLMKKLYLGITYGMGPKLLSESLGCTVDEAKQIIKDFYAGFTKVKEWMENTESFASKNGYVEDFWGRRRRLPDLLKDDYVVESSQSTFNPLFNVTISSSDNSKQIKQLQEKLKTCKSFTEVKNVKSEIESKGFKVYDNTNKISLSKRQCVNARIQGGAATMTKKAMIKIYHDKELNDLGFKLLIPVHDELIGECPTENSEKVADRLSYIMRSAASDLSVPFKCDTEIEHHWYFNECSAKIKKEFEELLQSFSKEESISKLLENHSEFLENQILELVNQ